MINLIWEQGDLNNSGAEVASEYRLRTEYHNIHIGILGFFQNDFLVKQKSSQGVISDVEKRLISTYIFFYDEEKNFLKKIALSNSNSVYKRIDFISQNVVNAKYFRILATSGARIYPEEVETPSTGNIRFLSFYDSSFDDFSFIYSHGKWLTEKTPDMYDAKTIDLPLPLSYWRIDNKKNNGNPWHERLLFFNDLIPIWSITQENLQTFTPEQKLDYWTNLLNWLKEPSNAGREFRVFDSAYKWTGITSDPQLLLASIMFDIDLDELSGSQFINDLETLYEQTYVLRQQFPDLSIWNPSVHKLWQDFYKRYNNIGRQNYEGETIDEKIIDNQIVFTTTGEDQLFGNITTYGETYRLTDILKADAGANFEDSPYDWYTVRFPWVVPWYNLDSNSYATVRGIDKIERVLGDEKFLNFTEYNKRNINLKGSFEQGYINDSDEEVDTELDIRTKGFFNIWNCPKINITFITKDNVQCEYCIRFYRKNKTGLDNYIREFGWFDTSTTAIIEDLENIEDLHYARIVVKKKDSSPISPDEIEDCYITYGDELNLIEENNPYLRLLMPQNKRRVEVEDLNRNFWVIGQVITAIQNEMFGDNGIQNIIKNVIKELADLWDNILFLWTAASIIPQKPIYTKWTTVVVPVYESQLRPYYKYDNFDVNAPSESYLKQIVSPVLSEYSNTNLLIIPEVRTGNYEHNYYSKVSFPYVLRYDRNEDAWLPSQALSVSGGVFENIEYDLSTIEFGAYYMIQENEDNILYYHQPASSQSPVYIPGRSYIMFRYDISFEQEENFITSFTFNLYDLGVQILPLEESGDESIFWLKYEYDIENDNATIGYDTGDGMQYEAETESIIEIENFKKGFYQGEILSYYHDEEVNE